MALIDVDRHILAQLVTIQQKIKLLSVKYEVEWQKVIEVRDKTDALFRPPAKGDDGEFIKLRNKIFRATRQCQKYANEIAGMIYKQEALLTHLCSSVLEVDTGKGRETTIFSDAIREGGKNAKTYGEGQEGKEDQGENEGQDVR